MSLMDKKGRLFGKVNLFDLLVILLVLVGVVGMSLRLVKERQEVAEGKTAICKVEIVDAGEYLKDAFEIGDALYEKETLLGTITSVQVKPAQELKLLTDGTAKLVDRTDHYDITLTFTTDRLMIAEGYRIDSAEWLAGTSHSISNGFAATAAIVRSIEIQ